MYNSRFILIVVGLLIAAQCYAQDCNFTVKGQVIDEGSNLPLSFVNVVLQENSMCAYTDDAGMFTIGELCEGEYHLIFSHIGCEPQKFHLDIVGDTIFNITLSHTHTELGGVIIDGNRSEHGYQSNQVVSRKLIEDNTNESLSGLIENEVGVHLIKNGSGIAKPIVHGLYGNRLIILNNGIAQSGQQWGNDHSPEIDPFAMDKITVIKGANALEYSGGNMGSVVLVEPKKISIEPHLHGQVSYVFETNGRGNNLNARLGKYSPTLAWKVSGTLKKYGDRKSPSYFLNNTGTEEANLSLQLEKTWNEKLFVDFYASTFNTKLGVLRGSHIGNIPDLERALEQEIPFYTESDFSYSIDAPSQQVSHHLAKLKAKYYISTDETLELILANQINNRKEFDVRRSGRSDTPALSLKQLTYNVDLKYSKAISAKWNWKVGSQNLFTDNTNNPETGILPLIPDYLSFRTGLFSTVDRKGDKIDINIGVRYDNEYQSVATIDNSSKEIIKYQNNFNIAGAIVGLKYELSATQALSINSGVAMRNPAINELYSNGLHQGVSGIEEGDIELKTERAIKNTIEYEWSPSTDFSINALYYYQRFADYIFLNPQDEVRPTIRGSFPVFKYEQTAASIYGLDISTQFLITKSIYGSVKYSYIKGSDLDKNIPLVYISPNSFFASLTYRASSHFDLFHSIHLEELEFGINNKLVLEQKNLLANQDFVAPPPTYNLIGVKLSTNVILPKYKFRFFVNVDNLLNVSYRDYLNRQRYFADDLGTSVSLGINFKF